MRLGVLLRRGKKDYPPPGGREKRPMSASFTGVYPRFRDVHSDFSHDRPQRPVRALPSNVNLLPVLYRQADQLMMIENALALKRTELQVDVALSQLAIGIRNAEEFLDKYLRRNVSRPTLHTLWYHENGLRHHQHVLYGLGTHHLVPLISTISVDVESGRMSLSEAVELYNELMDVTAAHSAVAQREVADQMIRTYCLHGLLSEARGVVEEMHRKGVRRSFVTYAPIFRHIRKTESAEAHIELLAFVRRIEGGVLPKILFIDVPRALYMFGVFARYNWSLIYFTAATAFFVAVHAWLNHVPPHPREVMPESF